jgi:SAM-dependent methyltransferase
LKPCEVSLIIPVKNATEEFENTVARCHDYLTQIATNSEPSFEIILVPNPARGDLSDQSIQICQSLSQKYRSVITALHTGTPGKGAAVKTGFLASHGNMIFYTDADLPYDLRFFTEARELLNRGYDLVSGNRRLASSCFRVPVGVLRLAYTRHRLGLAFNRLVRILFPISTTDTQAGIKALSRRLAESAFRVQTCTGFLFDLEIFLTAKENDYFQKELPVTLYLSTEKSTVRVLRECFSVAYWLISITWSRLQGRYGAQSMLSPSSKKITHRFSAAPLATRIFLWLRWKLTPYSEMASHLPLQGKFLDLGCGHGLFAIAAGSKSSSRQILGLDHDEERIRLGASAITDLNNIELKKGSLTHLPLKEKSSYTGVSMIDVMHYFPYKTQESIIEQSAFLLEKGGVLIMREVNPNGGITSRLNRIYEKVATKIGFTQTEKKEKLYFRTPTEWENVIKFHGLSVSHQRCSHFLG